MKKKYETPIIYKVQLHRGAHLLSGSNGNGVYTDDPQKPGNALSRQHDFWEEDDED